MKSYKIYFLALTALSAVSCSKVIDVNETNFIGGDVALQTVANNEQAIVGAYAGSGQEMDILLNATFSDEVKRAEFYNAATTHEWQYTSSDITIRDNFTAINGLYRVINRVNRVIDALPKADSTKVGDSALKVKLRGEALFLRAFSHFQLWRYYSGDIEANALAMVYMDYVPTSPAEKTSRITVQPYFDKLKADMAEAKNLIPNNLTDVNRATRLAVSGLQARVALYLKDWPGAITFSTEYINGLPLATRAQFPGIWTDANNNEVAWKLKRTTAAGGRIGSLFRGVSASATTIGGVTWAPSDKLWTLFDQTNDIRFASYLKDEPALANATPSRPSRIIAKYAGSGYATTAENINDAKMFRTGEMYLIRAEAKAETNDATAADDLNALRAARINGYVNAVFPTKQDLINAIMTERFKELAFEGHRFWDLRRRGLPVERLGSDAPSTTGATLPAGNFRFRLPIPNAEIQANSAMQQNEGYAN
ncbi:MAG: RagB/SusD family nutrient uptake outer membrane protein [Chitinophagaceae bacterium]